MSKLAGQSAHDGSRSTNLSNGTITHDDTLDSLHDDRPGGDDGGQQRSIVSEPYQAGR